MRTLLSRKKITRYTILSPYALCILYVQLLCTIVADLSYLSLFCFKLYAFILLTSTLFLREIFFYTRSTPAVLDNNSLLQLSVQEHTNLTLQVTGLQYSLTIRCKFKHLPSDWMEALFTEKEVRVYCVFELI